MLFSRVFSALATLAIGAVTVAADNSTTIDNIPALYKTLPECTLNCIIKALPLSSCDAEDIACTCTDAKLRKSVIACAVLACSTQDSLVARNFTATACNEPIRSRGYIYSHTSIVMACVTAVFVAARFGFRIYARDSIYPDDWVSLLTFFGSIPGTIINVGYLVPNGMGRDVWRLSIHQVVSFIHFFFALEILYFIHIGMLKTILLFFYLRIFPTPKVRKLLIGTIVFNVVFTLSFLVAGVFQCTPVSYFWTQWYGSYQGTCRGINAIVWVHATVGLGIDVWMLALPLSQLRHLNLHWKKKVGVGAMFVVGTFVTFVSAVRLATLLHFAESINPTWDFFQTGLWSTIEINVGIICSCMPCMRLILMRFFPQMFNSTASNGRSRPNHGSAFVDPSRGGVNTLIEANHKGDTDYGELDTSAIMMSRTFYVETEENKSINDGEESKHKGSISENEVV